MRIKKSPKTGVETKIDRLTKAVSNGFAAIAEDIADIKSRMATKSDIADMATKSDIADMATKSDIADMATKSDVRDIMHEELKAIRAELKDIRIRLTVLEESSKSHSGFSKEIDHVLRPSLRSKSISAS